MCYPTGAICTIWLWAGVYCIRCVISQLCLCYLYAICGLSVGSLSANWALSACNNYTIHSSIAVQLYLGSSITCLRSEFIRVTCKFVNSWAVLRRVLIMFIHSHLCAFILLRFINSLDLVGIHAYYSNSLTLACVFILLKFINSHVCVYITWIHYILFPGIRFILIWPLYDILALKVIITNVSLGLNKACAIICLSYDWRCKTSEMTKINENGLCYHDRYFGIRGPSDQFRPPTPFMVINYGAGQPWCPCSCCLWTVQIMKRYGTLYH